MDSVGVNVIETAALGRPFQLGMLYDCRKDALVSGITLWDKEQLQQSIRDRPQINTVFNVTASDSIEEKSHLLNIDGCLKLSLLSGLINVSGAAKYLSDTKKSFKQQRLTLHYHSTTKFEELTMNHLASGNIAHYEVFDNDTATHVVTAVLYGADACFVFDREVASDEDKSTVEGELKAAFDKLKGISVGTQIDLSLNDKQKTAVQKFTCKFYGDFQLQSNPASFEDALTVFADFPKLLGEKKELAVPLRVWLYPLDKLHSRAAKLQNDISIGLIKNVESVFETLSTTEMKCSDLLKDKPALDFPGFCDKIMQMTQNCSNYKLSFMKKVVSLLPKIRGDIEKETALIEFLRDHEDCPFRGSDLEQWVKEKEKESVIIKTLLNQLINFGATVEENLDKILMDLKVKNIVSYNFTSLDWPDVLLSKQKTFLNPSTKGNNEAPDSKPKTWFTSDIKTTLRSNLTIFKTLIESKTCEQVKFIVASKGMKNNPGSCILLYENGSDEATCFTPPSKPACPDITQISGHSVVLKVSPEFPATEELRLLYKMKEEKDWKSQSAQSQDTVTLTDLSPDTEYEMKYAAVGKLNYTVHSDVIHLRVIDKKLIDAVESVLERLSLTENKCSKLMEDNGAITFSAIHRKIRDMMRFCQTYKQDVHDRFKSTIQSIQACEKDFSALTDLLQAHEESPFNESDLTEWLTVKEKELKAVNVFLQQLHDCGAEVNDDLEVVLLDINIKNLVCYTFSSLDLPEDLLSDQENFLKPQMMKRNSDKKPNSVSQTWLTGSIRETMKKHLKIFKELTLSHGDQPTVFLVTSKEHTVHPGSCILLYENGSDEAACFTPPSKPACPDITQISGPSVVLKVSPACPATEELRLLYKMKEEKDWKSQSAQSQDTVTLTDLSPDTEYEMKYAAVGKLNYTVHSDVIRVTTHTANIREESTRSTISNDVKVCIFRTGKTNSYDKDFTDMLKSRIENLTEASTVSQSDIILVFCPVVSRAGTDIDNALERFNYNTETKLAVLVVLHHTFDPEKVVPDSSKYVKRTDILTVDCLFHEDMGFLKCQMNSDAADKTVNWLIQQGRQTGVKICPHQPKGFKNLGKIQFQEYEKTFTLSKRQKMGNNEPSKIPVHFPEKVKVFSISAGNLKNCHKEFFDILRNRTENLKEGRTVDESDIILVFCPIVSRTGTDIEAALNNFVYSTGSKLTVLVVLHHTFDPEKMVPDSSQYVKRTDILTVDCLFHEDMGFLKCQMNSDAADKTVNWLIQQGAKRGITLSPCQLTHSNDKSSGLPHISTSLAPAHRVGFPKQKSNMRDSCRPVDYFVHVTKDTRKCDVDFIDALHKQVSLRNVQRVQESEIILLFCPVYSPSDIHAILQEYHKRPDKPAVVIFLHDTLDSDCVPNSSGYVKSPDILVIDCIFFNGEGLPDCKKNREAISAVADWIKKLKLCFFSKQKYNKNYCVV